ncbi:uncharacterized protein LOC128304009 [Anopheles moucheti]|uniref:uncharacterized protein LOC128304009 n=1 Tax=Anopheles moucheti TaxID=186751 RepID=UPI0022EFF274|nr:uncharacterized protein LOC128304009 [Anopheles moucheti]
MALSTEMILQIPKLNLETVKICLEKHKLAVSSVEFSPTLSTLPYKSFKNITVVSMKLENNSTLTRSISQRSLTADIEEVEQRVATRSSRKTCNKKHIIVLEFTGNQQNISSAFCTKCSAANESCNAIYSFFCWIQLKSGETKAEKENKKGKVPIEENAAKKRMLKRECRVLLERVVYESYKSMPLLKKLQVKSIPFTSDQLELARKLSMVHLIREFEGDDAIEFLAFCTARMKARACDNVALLTIGQADTDLWHELRIGRITASRIREAAHCTMMNGSLMKSIMGVSSGFSFAMKRGTDLEGHVLAELRKEYPELQNAGLMLDPDCPWMGASPDGICDGFVLEIKCPYTVKTHDCYVDVKKLAPKYFAQIQLQMHVTKRKKALLAVAALDFEKTKQITKVWINYNKVYVNEVIESAFDYWCKAVFKALQRKRTSKK